jgi:hypothetical protein
MSAWALAAAAGGIAAAVAVTVVLARLLAAVTSLDRTTRDLVHTIEDVRRDALRSTNGAGAAQPDGTGDDGLHPALSSGGGSNGRVRQRPFDLSLASPVIKARALGRGTSEAARQFLLRRER